jgi:hypothetical protein
MFDPNLKIRADYPGGNIKVMVTEDRTVKLEQDLRDTVEWWFYWNFAAENAVEQEVVFQFTNGEVLGPWGPAVSEDLVNWRWLGKESLINREAFTYQFTRPGEIMYFAFSIPYQVRNFESFYGRYQGHPLLQRKNLTFSEQGRPVPMLVLGNPGGKKDLMFTARHHACEASASYLLEGFIGELLNRSQSPLWEKYRIHVIPLVDIDGVENGDQGKSRTPHDHNRDYLPEPVYKVTQAIMEYVRTLNLTVGIDFHSPYKWGDRNDYPFFVKQASPIKEETEKLGAVLRDITSGNFKFGGIEYDQKHDLEMGEEWNQPVHPTCSSFFRQQKAAIACTFEVPYFGTGNPVFTPENSRRFGADFARALEIYLTSG